ncbi:MAG: 3-deoxy-D-manno-octulosonic acid transferase [Candidatus Omnitrophota bacterium]|jgi:3-deoxy-D-manno-octulosonic-acid transferase|nr:MAG: 3-deoxy-D-manno-octulosonic acid transferase [Candidatus Omnitrophota bacterium]
MAILYDIVFFCIAICYLPMYAVRRKFHPGFLARLGVLPKNLKLVRPIWIHAVSVGEAMAVRGLYEKLKERFPEKNFVISTVTPTGNTVVRHFIKDGDFVCYLPLDISAIVRRVIERINPSMVVIAETEFWPNIISYLYKKNIPIVVVNGRISDRSFRGYLFSKLLVRPVLRKISLYCVQTETDYQRLKRLGVDEAKLKITGNMKFDRVTASPQGSIEIHRESLQIAGDAKVLLAGSTHPGEEEIILRAYAELGNTFPSLRLILAPRHPERAAAIVRIVKRFGFEPVLISSGGAIAHSPQKKRVFIIDSIGQLLAFYAFSDIVFVGGSLVRKGGHNILEPVSLGKPVLFGPYTFNFRDIVEAFLTHDAAVLVHNEKEMALRIADLLRNQTFVMQITTNAQALMKNLRGATEKNSELLGRVYVQSRDRQY